MKATVLALFLTACSRDVVVKKDAGVVSNPTAPPTAETPAPAPEIDAAAQAKYDADMLAWMAKTRKACGLKPDSVIFPKTKRAMLQDCNEAVAAGLPPGAKFPTLPDDDDRKGLQTADGCRYWVDSYVETQGVKARFRCKYDPSILGRPDVEVLR